MNLHNQDPRNNNIWFDDSSVKQYFLDYQSNLQKALSTLDSNELEKAYQLMDKIASQQGTFFVCGNGGSNAIAEHLCCDWTKGTYIENKVSLRTICLNSNGPLLTAAANDFGFEKAMGYLLQIQAKPIDALIVISSSGKSANIIEAITVARKLNIPVMSLTGFSGGKAKELADIKLHVEFANYAIIEDAHQAIVQCLAQFFYSKKNKQY